LPVETQDGTAVLALEKEDFFENNLESGSFFLLTYFFAFSVSLQSFKESRTMFGRVFVLTEGNQIEIYSVCC
jgi:hypothetical protein